METNNKTLLEVFKDDRDLNEQLALGDDHSVATLCLAYIAPKVAIDFMNWTLQGTCYYTAIDENEWINAYDENKRYTTKELFQIFLNQYEVK